MANNDQVIVNIKKALKDMNPKDLFTQIVDTGSALDKKVIKEFKVDPPSRQFVLLHESWWVTVAFMNYVELVLNPNTDYSDINTLFTSMQGSAETFTGSIEDQVVTLAHEVMNHAEDAQGHFDTIKETLFNEAIGSSPGAKEFARAAFKEAVGKMKQGCDDQKAKADAITKKLNSIADALSNYEKTATQLSQKYTSQDGTLTLDIKTLQEQVKLDQSQVSTYHSQYEKWCKLAETAPVYLAIPFVGPFISVADAITFTALAVTWLNKYKDAKETLIKDQSKLNKDIVTEAHVEHALAILKKVNTELNTMIPIVGLIAGAWSNYSSQIDNLDKNADLLFEHGTSTDFTTMGKAADDLNVVKSDWLFVKKASETWANIAKIAKMPLVDS